MNDIMVIIKVLVMIRANDSIVATYQKFKKSNLKVI